MNNPIGVFDSGLGGLTAFKELSTILPNENIVYFGDTGRVPYGNRSYKTIKKYALQDINFLQSLGIKMILVACGTVSSVVNELKDKINVPFIEVISPTAQAAYRATHTKRIGVIGTRATIKSSAYKNELKKIDESVEVFQRECDLFVPLVENGFAVENNKIVELAVEYYLEDIRKKHVDTLILGCTHYPLLKKSIQKFMGNNVKLIDSGRETAKCAATLLKNRELEQKNNNTPVYKFFSSDATENFLNTAKIFLNKDIVNDVVQIDIEKF